MSRGPRSPHKNYFVNQVVVKAITSSARVRMSATSNTGFSRLYQRLPVIPNIHLNTGKCWFWRNTEIMLYKCLKIFWDFIKLKLQLSITSHSKNEDRVYRLRRLQGAGRLLFVPDYTRMQTCPHNMSRMFEKHSEIWARAETLGGNQVSAVQCHFQVPRHTKVRRRWNKEEIRHSDNTTCGQRRPQLHMGMFFSSLLSSLQPQFWLSFASLSAPLTVAPASFMREAATSQSWSATLAATWLVLNTEWLGTKGWHASSTTKRRQHAIQKRIKPVQRRSNM